MRARPDGSVGYHYIPFTETDMHRVIAAALCVAVAALVVPASDAALPIRKPDAEATVEKVVPATDAEKQKGVVVTVFLKDRKDGVQVTKNTAVHKQMGKLVPVVE